MPGGRLCVWSLPRVPMCVLRVLRCLPAGSAAVCVANAAGSAQRVRSATVRIADAAGSVQRARSAAVRVGVRVGSTQLPRVSLCVLRVLRGLPRVPMCVYVLRGVPRVPLSMAYFLNFSHESKINNGVQHCLLLFNETLIVDDSVDNIYIMYSV